MQKITPFLWFDHGQAEDAAALYVSLFEDSEVTEVSRFPADTPSAPEGDVMTVNFRLAGQEYTGLNGGPEFPFTEAVSLAVLCEDQAEVDRLWDALIAGGGQPSQCGWLKDRFGLSWQIVPKRLNELMADPDPDRARRATEAMLQMGKLDVAALEAAADAA
jgi:predicted 3-demethylubiquinone-9 3-methyltransferase (glyoxalase superfamily)